MIGSLVPAGIVISLAPACALRRLPCRASPPAAGAEEELRNAGHYLIAITSGGADINKDLYIAPAAPEKINFLARPSRVPVGQPKVIAGTAFVFDQYENLVTAPTPVTFELSVPGAPAKIERLTAKNGVAYLQTGSGRKAGPGQFVVKVGDNSVRRVVEETASEPCNLRFKLHKEKEGLIAETDRLLAAEVARNWRGF